MQWLDEEIEIFVVYPDLACQHVVKHKALLEHTQLTSQVMLQSNGEPTLP